MKWMLLIMAPIMLFVSGCGGPKKISYRDPESVSYKVHEKTEIKNQQDLKEAIEVIEKNLEAAEKEDIPAYLSTIIKAGHEDTSKELEDFFESYDLEHTILGITVLDQKEDKMLLEVTQQSVATFTAEDADEYKNHVAVANHTLVKEDGQWKIAETAMVENYFIEE